MGRKKIKIERIPDERNRSVTFTKRKNGLLKKARELSILCDCDITVLIFNNASGRCFEFSSDETSRTLTRFATYEGDVELRGLGEVRSGAATH
eukprot:contig_34154_g8226